MTRIARRDGLHEAPRTTLAHQLDTALDSRSGVDPCERPALHTRPDPPNDPGLDPGVDVAPSPERGGHHPVVAPQKCAGGLDQRVPFLSLTELTQAPRRRPRGAQTAKPWVGVALQGSIAAPTLHTISIAVGLPGIGPGDVQMDSSNPGPPDRSSTGVLFGQSATSQKAHHVPHPP